MSNVLIFLECSHVEEDVTPVLYDTHWCRECRQYSEVIAARTMDQVLQYVA